VAVLPRHLAGDAVGGAVRQPGADSLAGKLCGYLPEEGVAALERHDGGRR
jgi:hypothetical protein